MKVSVKLIATYHKNLPPGTEGNVCEVDLPTGISAFELLARFDVPPMPESVVLVNGRVPSPDYLVQEGDVVCAFPAIAGG